MIESTMGVFEVKYLATLRWVFAQRVVANNPVFATLR